MKQKNKDWKNKLYQIIYEAETPAGKLFDLILLFVILLGVTVVILESVEAIMVQYGILLNQIEWAITILFTVEYFLRIICVNKPLKYIFSFYGLVDLLSTLPKYLGFFIGKTEVFKVLRALRLLRIFRILKLVRYTNASNTLYDSIKASKAKIGVFLFAVVILSVILGTTMYWIESDVDSGFTSIPRSIYWAIVTLTTVGYGDIAPVTVLGQFFASLIMITGYGIIAVPTGIVIAEYKNQRTTTYTCTNCHEDNHLDEALHCHQCGEKLHQKK